MTNSNLTMCEKEGKMEAPQNYCRIKTEFLSKKRKSEQQSDEYEYESVIALMKLVLWKGTLSRQQLNMKNVLSLR